MQTFQFPRRANSSACVENGVDSISVSTTYSVVKDANNDDVGISVSSGGYHILGATVEFGVLISGTSAPGLSVQITVDGTVQGSALTGWTRHFGFAVSGYSFWSATQVVGTVGDGSAIGANWKSTGASSITLANATLSVVATDWGDSDR